MLTSNSSCCYACQNELKIDYWNAEELLDSNLLFCEEHWIEIFDWNASDIRLEKDINKYLDGVGRVNDNEK